MDPVVLGIITTVSGAILGIILERIVKITSFFKKSYHFLKNSTTNLKVSFLFNVPVISTEDLILKIKDNFYKNSPKWKVESDFSSISKKIIYSNGSLYLTFLFNVDDTLIIETSDMGVPLREVGGEFDSTCDIIDKISKELNFTLLKVEFKAKLPYYQDLAQFHLPRHFKIEDYTLEMKDKKLDLELRLTLGVITATHDNISQLKSVFGRLIAF
ncbi:MAG: hypothetical protein ACREBF_04775 [Candidatus Micrarchaeales archaeon]